MNRKHKTLVLLLLLTGWVACSKIDISAIQNLNDGRVMVIGHGGSGFPGFSNQLPSNSWKSISRALEGLNADAVDIDIQMSADNQLVLYHDLRLESLTDCYGCIAELGSETIQDCCYRNDFSNNITENQSVLLLDDVLAYYADSPFNFLLDLKPFSNCGEDVMVDLDTFALVLTEMVQRHGMEDRILFNSFFVDLLIKLKEQNSNFIIYKDGVDFDVNFNDVINNGFDGISMSNLEVLEEQVLRAHEHDIRFIIYSVKERFGMSDALRKNPDGIITDNIELLQNFLSH